MHIPCLCSIKLGVIDDHANRTRLSKLLRFRSSHFKGEEKLTGLADYVSRMKDKQEHIFFMAGSSMKEVSQSPFVERLIKKGYEVNISSTKTLPNSLLFVSSEASMLV